VTKDSSGTCTPLNILGHGVFCCQGDLCNSATKTSFSVLISLFSTMYFLIFRFYWSQKIICTCRSISSKSSL